MGQYSLRPFRFPLGYKTCIISEDKKPVDTGLASSSSTAVSGIHGDGGDQHVPVTSLAMKDGGRLIAHHALRAPWLSYLLSL